MITNVASKVDLPATATRTNQPAAPPTNQRVGEHSVDSTFSLSSPRDRAAIEQAVGKVKESLQQSGSRFQIEVDPDLNRVVVKILNGESGEVIRQIPPQEVIDLAKNLSGAKGSLFEEHA